MPPLEITVDYGDGTILQTWTQEDPRNFWNHIYVLPGVYTIRVKCKSYSLVLSRLLAHLQF